MDDRFAFSECILTAPQYKVENFKFGFFNLYIFFVTKKLKKSFEIALSLKPTMVDNFKFGKVFFKKNEKKNTKIDLP